MEVEEDKVIEVDNTRKSGKVKSSRRGQKPEKQKPPTKIVIRNLPPTMTEEDFLQQIDPIPEHDSYFFCLADWSLGLEATCRAYITMKNVDDVFLFRDRFDGYVFVDSRGTEYVAIVEYAPFQGLLKKKSRNYDSKENTIELDPLYLQYLEKLTAEREEDTRMGDIKTDFMLDRKAEDKITSTPLLQYLASKKEKRREEAKKRNEEKRRQREEDKQRQTQQKTPKAGQNKSNEIKQINNKKDGKGSPQVLEERKNSRSKRRAERDQRRREEHAELRKKTRERTNREQNCKGDTLEQKSLVNLKEENTNGAKIVLKSGRGNETVRRKDKDAEQKNVKSSEPILMSKTKPTVDPEVEEVSEAVKNFLLSVAGGNESNSLKSTNDCDDGSLQTDISQENLKLDKLRSLEERRIRNKDRPSMAIYQPKASLSGRLRTCEEKAEKQNEDGSPLNANIECESSSTFQDKKPKRSTSRRAEHRPKQVPNHEEEIEKADHFKSPSLEEDNVANIHNDES